MANVNDGKFFDNKIAEGNNRSWPTMTSWFKGTGKKVTAGLTLAAAFMIVCTALSNLLPDIPQDRRKFSGKPDARFSEGGRNDRRDSRN